jgi:hypothetical protein
MTQYSWPTWADIIGTKFKYFENWGEAGAGNHFIFNSIIECDIKNVLTPNDTVIIMWTSPARHDYFSGNRWGHAHHIFNTDNEMLPCPDGYWGDTFAYIHAIDQIFKNRKIPYVMASWINYTTLKSKFHLQYKRLLSTIYYVRTSLKPHQVPKIADIDNLMKLLYDALSGPDWPSLESIKNNQYSTTPEIQKEIDNFWEDLKQDTRVKIASMVSDRHPLPGEHLQIAKKIFPELDIDLNTKEWTHLLDNKIKNGEHISFDKHLPERNYNEYNY